MSKVIYKHFDRYCPQFPCLRIHFKYCTYQVIITVAVKKTETAGTVSQSM